MTQPSDHGVQIPAGDVKPAWLRSKDPEKFAAAMVQCQSGSGNCAEDGRCAHRNWCFSMFRDRYLRLEATKNEIARRMSAMMNSEAGDL